MVQIHTAKLDERPGAGRLGRHVEHDPRSRGFAQPSGPAPTAPILWHRWSPILDQGDLGSCTGNAMTGLLGCSPYLDDPVKAATFDERFAVDLYELATKLDRIAGTYPPDDTGSTGLAVAKATKQLGFIASYAWAFTTAAMIHALQFGPVIVGIPWYLGFDSPDPDTGLVSATGIIRGGHEVLVRGFTPGAGPGTYVGTFHADNSWGESWGRGGSFSFTASTWEKLRAGQADVTVPKLP